MILSNATARYREEAKTVQMKADDKLLIYFSYDIGYCWKQTLQ